MPCLADYQDFITQSWKDKEVYKKRVNNNLKHAHCFQSESHSWTTIYFLIATQCVPMLSWKQPTFIIININIRASRRQPHTFMGERIKVEWLVFHDLHQAVFNCLALALARCLYWIIPCPPTKMTDIRIGNSSSIRSSYTTSQQLCLLFICLFVYTYTSILVFIILLFYFLEHYETKNLHVRGTLCIWP